MIIACLHAQVLVDVLTAESITGDRLHEVTKSYHMGLGTHQEHGLIWAACYYYYNLFWIGLLYKAA